MVWIRKSVQEIGFVFQNPANQIVADKSGMNWLGLENLGLHAQIRKKIAMASFFNIEDLFQGSRVYRGENNLNLASIMVMV